MAEVYLARVAGPGGFEKTLVLKRVLPHLAEDQQFIAMFNSEAKLAARLSHPNVVSIFDFGREGDDWFLVMEFIDGPNLHALLRRAVEREQPLALNVAAKIISCACEGLAYAHDFKDPVTGAAIGLVHRDISADNILLGKNGEVKVVDFGIAKAIGQSHQTDAGMIKGKVTYMSPEQLRGDPLDRRTDVFSLGLVLYELVAGDKPFPTESEPRAIHAILSEKFPPVTKYRPDAPPELQRILDLSLAKDRNARYRDCRQFQLDLDRFINGLGAPPGPQLLALLVARLMDAKDTRPSDPRLPMGPNLLGQALGPAERPTLPQLDSLSMPTPVNLQPALGPVPRAPDPTDRAAFAPTQLSLERFGPVPLASDQAAERQSVTEPVAPPLRDSADHTQPALDALARPTAPRQASRPVLRVLAWVAAGAVAVGILALGVRRDRALSEAHGPPGKLLQAGSFKVHVVDQLGPGRAVVLLHGDPGSSLDFAGVQHLLGPTYRTLSVDRPGHGWTDRPRAEMTPRDEARMLHDALKQLLLTRPVLVGTDFATPVITAWALEYPDDVGALVFVCPIADPPAAAARYPELKLPVEALVPPEDRLGGPSHLAVLEKSLPQLHAQRLEHPCAQVLSRAPEEVFKAVTRAIDRTP